MEEDRPSLKNLHDSRMRIAHFELRELLGRGGMGEVWRAHDVMLQRDVAVKVLAEDCHLGAEAEARLVLEARAASALDHPGIVQVYQLGNEHGRIFIAMEYVGGKTLAELLAQGPLEPGRVLDVVGQVAAALGAAHEAALVHRDVKPDNIIVRADGRAKVLDFGLVHAARELGGSLLPPPPEGAAQAPAPAPAEAGDTMLVLGCTVAKDGRQTAVAGTPLYMAPEQLDGAATAASDQFALAACTFELLTGRSLRSGRTINQVLLSDIDEALRRAEDALPPKVGPVLSRALAQDPAERYPTIGDFSEALTEAIRPLPLPPPTIRHLRRRAWLLPAIVTVVLAVVAGFLWFQRPAAQQTVKLAIVPGNRVLFAQLYAPLGKYLSEQVGTPVQIEIPESYAVAMDGLVSGQYQLAFLSPSAYVEAHAQLPDLVLLGGRTYHGKISYHSVIVTRDTSITTLRDLRGKKMCLVDKRSTSGYVMPRRMLLNAGVDPRTDLGGMHLSGDHFNALRDLQAGKCVAAAVSSMELADAPRQGLRTQDLRELARSPALPPIALVARGDFDPVLRDSIQAAMRNAMSAGIFDYETALSEQMGVFQNVEDSDYDIVRQID